MSDITGGELAGAPRPSTGVPRGVVILGACLIVFTIVLAGVARRTNNNHVVLAPTEAVAARDLAFKDLSNGGIAVTDASTGQSIAIVPPKTGGFLRGVMRGLVHDHRRYDDATGYAFRLTRWADGRLSIEDPGTHEHFELEAFGSTNEKVFADFLGTTPGAERGR
jgi:putative photosynthetic complex assembly protein